MLPIFAGLPFGQGTTALMWELKSIGLAVIFVYAFFKFAWSYRLFNYMAIVVGSRCRFCGRITATRRFAVARQAAEMNAVAGTHFNRGQRAFFFSLAYLGWFVSPYLFIAATAGVLYVMWRRQFVSGARAAVMRNDGTDTRPLKRSRRRCWSWSTARGGRNLDPTESPGRSAATSRRAGVR